MHTASRISCLTLTTDFGLTDEYVGVVKGVMLRYAPAVNIVDLCHCIAPQNILQAAYLLEASHDFFPVDSLHVVVVDPGVGTDRRILWAKTDKHFFLAPDNGILTLILRSGKVEQIRSVSNSGLFLSPLSATFHGRDIFAPVAGQLAAGLSPDLLGPLVEPSSLQLLPLRLPQIDMQAQSITGHVIGHDSFGNLQTNIHLRDLERLAVSPENLTIYIGDRSLGKLRRHYRQSSPGLLLALLGSRNYLEIAASMESAAELLPEASSLPVTVKNNDLPASLSCDNLPAL